MKAKTIFQKHVYALSKKLPNLDESKKKWLVKNYKKFYAHANKKEITCFECAHVWKQTPETLQKEFVVCPSCKRKLEVKYTNHRKFFDESIYQVICVVEDFQVVRTFAVWHNCRLREASKITFSEIFQQWLKSDGKQMVMAVYRNAFGNWGMAGWHYGSAMEIRNNVDLNCYYPEVEYIYPKFKLLPVLKRNGITNNFHGYYPMWIFKSVLNNSVAETLLKAGQYELIEYYRRIERNYWGSVKICIRNNYIIKEPQLWFDTIDNLREFNQDDLNPQNVCPADLLALHDYYVEKTRRRRERQDRQYEIIKKAEKLRRESYTEELYTKEKGHFFDLKFETKDITVVPLKSIEEFKTIGDDLKLCIHFNYYFTKVNSLLFCACKGNENLEVAEFNLEEMKVVQIYGKEHKITAFNKTIISLINENANQINKRKYGARKREKLLL